MSPTGKSHLFFLWGNTIIMAECCFSAFGYYSEKRRVPHEKENCFDWDPCSFCAPPSDSAGNIAAQLQSLL